MHSKTLTPSDLFGGRVSYEIPPFQRPYVWLEDDQWQPLWDDIERLAQARLQASDPAAMAALPRHFLGAVVLKQMPNGAGDPERRAVIDGQQRLTTLQVLLHAAHLVMGARGLAEQAESLQELIRNGSARFAGTSKRFKVWPSRSDRAAFESVMDGRTSPVEDDTESRIAKAHSFFFEQIDEWTRAKSEEQVGEGRLKALAEVLQERLQIVAIDLADNDDDQLIFETINDRGTPLLAADLIKNHVFQRCEELGAAVDDWVDSFWADFDDDWWRQKVAQGRLYRSRIDIFLQYWLTMQLKEEVPTEDLFRKFREHAKEPLRDIPAAESFLCELRHDANRFREFAELDPNSPGGAFYTRVIEALELGAFTPLLLYLLRDSQPAAESSKALAAVESWAVRRTLLRRTMKDVNKLVVAMLKELDRHPVDRAGETMSTYLRAQTADARQWPSDEEIWAQFPSIRVYGSVKQQRLRAVLTAIELHWRGPMGDDATIPSKLEIEHVMPQGWRSHWSDGVNPEAASERDQLINTIGNLTLVTKKLNLELSNRPWTDEATKQLGLKGDHEGRGKCSLLNCFGHLTITSNGVTNCATWDEQQIASRGKRLAQAVTEVWPR